MIYDHPTCIVVHKGKVVFRGTLLQCEEFKAGRSDYRVEPVGY